MAAADASAACFCTDCACARATSTSVKNNCCGTASSDLQRVSRSLEEEEEEEEEEEKEGSSPPTLSVSGRGVSARVGLHQHRAALLVRDAEHGHHLERPEHSSRWSWHVAKTRLEESRTTGCARSRKVTRLFRIAAISPIRFGNHAEKGTRSTRVGGKEPSLEMQTAL